MMKTESYNPSSLEVEMANIIEALKEKINEEFKNRHVTSIEHKLEMDNPTLNFHIQDEDGDKHILVLKLIQKPDDLV